MNVQINHILALIVAAASLCLACVEQTNETKSDTPTTKSDPRSQYVFAGAWGDVHNIKDASSRYRAALKLGKEWEGRRYNWTGYLVANLCQEVNKTCAVHVFNASKTPSANLVGGHFPRVTFSTEGWERLRRECRGTKSCVVQFEGDLTLAQTDLDRNLLLAFSNADVIETRAPMSHEGWFKKKQRVKVGRRSIDSLRTGNPSPTHALVKRLKATTF